MTAPTSRTTRQFFSAARQQWQQLVHQCISTLERERRAQIVAVVTLCLVCTSVFAESVVTARSQREKWTSNVSVLVLTTDVPARAILNEDNTNIITLPRALVATDALQSLPVDTQTRVALTANTPLTSSLVIPSSDAINVPAGWRIIALPPDITTPRLTRGDRVDVIIGDTVVATDSIVVSLEPFTIAVPAEVIPLITAASRVGDVFVAARS